MDTLPHILVVDDHQEIRELVRRFLGDHGYRVSVAANGAEMKKTLADAAIDLIVLDLMMPGEDGLTLCRNLRVQSDIPVIMLTAKGREVEREKGLAMGADYYVTKPFATQELVAKVQAALEENK